MFDFSFIFIQLFFCFFTIVLYLLNDNIYCTSSFFYFLILFNIQFENTTFWIVRFLCKHLEGDMILAETCGVTLSVLRFACRTIEHTQSDYITGIAFETLHAVSMKFKHFLKGESNTVNAFIWIVYFNLIIWH